MFRKLALAFAAVSAMLLPSPADAAKSTAAQVVSAISAAISQAPAVDAAFTLRQSGQPPMSGTAYIQGRKFTLELPRMRVWFDGKTQWAYSKDVEEVNVTEPTDDELAETNPLAIITANLKNCKARRLDAPAGADRVELVPSGRTSFRKAAVTSDASTNFLREIAVTMNDGTSVTITFSSMKKASKKPDSYFRFSQKLVPSARIVDLR